MTGNLQADGVQSRQTLFVRYCLQYCLVASISASEFTPLNEMFIVLGQYRTKIVRQMRRQIFRQMKQKAE